MKRIWLNIVFVLFFIAAVVSTFAAGKYIGEYDAQKKALMGLNESTNSTAAYNFIVLSKAILQLREAKAVEADTVILRYAKLQIPKVLDCARSVQCSDAVGKLMPTSEEIEKIRYLEELKN